jgi:predicted nucleic-acid-binding protein
MRAVDTNVVVRVIVRDDLNQTTSAESFIPGGAWISLLALAEAIWVLGRVYRLNANELVAAIEMLLNHRDFILQDAETVTAALDLFRERPGLGFSDCLILSIARQAGHLPLGTFDRYLARVEGVQKL